MTNNSYPIQFDFTGNALVQAAGFLNSPEPKAQVCYSDPFFWRPYISVRLSVGEHYTCFTPAPEQLDQF